MLFMNNVCIVCCAKNEGFWPLSALEVGKFYSVKITTLDWKLQIEVLGSRLPYIYLLDWKAFNEYFRVWRTDGFHSVSCFEIEN